MNKLTAVALIGSGIIITVLVKKHDKLVVKHNDLLKDLNKVNSAKDIMQRIIESQLFLNPDGFMIPESIMNDMDAFTILSQNNMI